MPDYNQTHEINSRRMINLCLSMRGFCLKTGQFLGTRHDFMPINSIKKRRTRRLRLALGWGRKETKLPRSRARAFHALA